MTPSSVKHVTLPDKVWNMVVDEKERCLYLDTRKNEQVILVRLNLADMSFRSKTVDNKWWTRLVYADAGALSFVEYLDSQNPNELSYFVLGWDDMNRVELGEAPSFENNWIIPHIYEQGTAYHKTVAEFLALDLSLSCEYLEWNDKIIISYYLRSGNGYDRYLLLLGDGKKEWKLLQDEQMQGFSSGSFFVFNDQLIFIKDQNEVCVYIG